MMKKRKTYCVVDGSTRWMRIEGSVCVPLQESMEATID
jgi:hypothetical protein